MATKSLGLSTPLQIMRKVIFQLYTFFASKVARKWTGSEGGGRAAAPEPKGIGAIHGCPSGRHFRPNLGVKLVQQTPEKCKAEAVFRAVRPRTSAIRKSARPGRKSGVATRVSPRLPGSTRGFRARPPDGPLGTPPAAWRFWRRPPPCPEPGGFGPSRRSGPPSRGRASAPPVRPPAPYGDSG